ncbi:MAG: helix-turn-helix transcriptional regulator, partial [Chloroflexota bacterium]
GLVTKELCQMLTLYTTQTPMKIELLQSLFSPDVEIRSIEPYKLELVHEGEVRGYLVSHTYSQLEALIAGLEFTIKQKKVLGLLIQGRRNREIGDELGIGVKAVERHITNILKKLKLRSRCEIISKAAQQEEASAIKPVDSVSSPLDEALAA